MEKTGLTGLLRQWSKGKSTLIKMMSGVVTPDTGKIFVDGKETRISTRKESEEDYGMKQYIKILHCM